ncbi:MAG: 4Fe-4S binding protein [Nitrospinae bacterium]|nr:4Fe-4S binding protein [Nitrospinota bacterium]
MRILRRVTQLAFLLLFLILLIKTDYAGTNQIPYPVKLFLDLDPLALLAVLLPSRGLPSGFPAALFGSVLLLALTLVGGRFFCGWICPLGSLHHLCSLRRGGPTVEQRRQGAKGQGGKSSQAQPPQERRRTEALPLQGAKASNSTSGQSFKVYLLVGLLVAAAFSLQLLGLLDPFSLLIRSLSVGLLPALNYALHSLFSFLYETTGGAPQQASELLYSWLKARFLSFHQPYFQQSLFLSLVLLTLLYLNRVRPRFWCRLLCPLGALLSLLSRFSLWQLQADERCNGCSQCLKDCQGGARPYPAVEWRRGECLLCLNCQESCPRQALHFGLTWPWRHPTQGLDLQRRHLLISALAGLSLPALVRPSLAARLPQPQLIRPPGSLPEREFLNRCIRCGECLKVCLTNGLQPTLWEAGAEGIWTPRLVSKMGYCEYSCTLCGQVCPTGAIRELKEEEKARVVIGLAFIDPGRCLPYAFGIECIVCEEHCPTPKKAIYFELKAVSSGRGGPPRPIKMPRVDPKLCIGCGICEHKCPVADRSAITITSVGESRNPENQLFL